MKRFNLLAIYVVLIHNSMFVFCQEQKAVSGKVVRITQFQSNFVDARNIDIWLPEKYDGKKKYAVLYMHDGQMLFDSATTWNHQTWNVDDVLSQLMKDNIIRNVIVVGIWNSGGNRHPDYFPQKPFEGLPQAGKDTVTARLQTAGRVKTVFMPRSDSYLKFIVEELKPYIEKNYSVRKKRKDTFIAGSSMGGLISMYAICEYPRVFGGAICMSTHWPGIFTLENNPVPDAFLNYLSQNLPRPGHNNIYFDCGDRTLDKLYPEIQKKVDSIMVARGYNSKNWLTKYFTGEDHSEKSWSKRFSIPALFILGIKK